MKRYVIIVLIVAMLVSSCQATPEDNTIQSKSENLVQEVIDANQEENREALQEDKEVINEQIEKVDRHLELDIDTANPLSKIVVNADISIPQYETIPLLRLKPKNLSKEQLERFIKYIAGDEPVYYEPDTVETNLCKDEIENELTRLKSYLGNDLEAHRLAHLKDRIEHLESSYKDAVNHADEIPYNGELKTRPGGKGVSLKIYLGNATADWLSLHQADNNVQSYIDYLGGEVAYNTSEPYIEGMEHRVKISYEEALEKAKETVAILDGEDTNFTLSNCRLRSSYGGANFQGFTKDNAPQCFHFDFVRQYNGLNVMRINTLFGTSEGPMRDAIKSEIITLSVNDKGICWLHWGNHSELVDQISEDVPLIAFDEVLNIFQKQCKYQFTWSPKGDSKPKDLGCTIDVSRVEMNLMVTAEKDNLETYLLIPVWDFIGDVNYDQKVIGQDGYEYEGSKNVSILTINAIDGTIINREQGY